MLSYYQELVNKKISSPGTDIFVNDNKYISPKPTVMSLEEKQGFLKNNFIIKDRNGIECFKCEKGKTITSSKNGEPLLILKEGNLSSYMKIVGGNNKNKVIATINTKDSVAEEKYKVTYFNQASEREEILEMNCDATYRSCGIFYGKENEGAPLICKIIEMKSKSFFSNKTNYTIEIASGVDNLFMTSLAICLTEMKEQYQMNLNDD
ncbi:hypothetical protein H8356DRAFT_1746596 [Neocallimastix lanati (nom. inval.)]|uniref:Uncharacterized protein n=1 Tax=Neocallimastix californiae TaxID=1754190 RepID=A0A1Y2BW29_9FUNG|nr:hypothetical protein H8356DRAFT_1746596 [Neocallimastix sp. JGI-2020a]ORY38952.1 hypothetical protein LY90DRAFT_704372 [Neocallimastix californiae]|eukprot:ORY38952.1 hypothetical protein LY90DRAFT_704372 [Neocallimastix californiae]